MSKYDVIMMVLCLILVSSVIGGHFGYEVSGKPAVEDQPVYDNAYYHDLENDKWYYINPMTGYFTEIPEPDPKEKGAGDLIGDAVGYFVSMLSFQIVGIPAWVGIIFIICLILVLLVVASLIRGGG